MNGPTKYMVAAAFALGGTVATVAAGSAMPMVPVAPAGSALTEHVAWGCGPGWHPNRWGRCVPYRRVIYPRFYSGPGFYVWHGPIWHRWHRW